MIQNRIGKSDDPARELSCEPQATLQELQQRNAELSAALKARDAFLAIASHELRNPMTPIVGHVQRLRRMIEARSCTMDDVETGLKRIEWLVDLYVKRAVTLLDVSRITSGKLRLDLERVDISKLAHEVAATLDPAAHYAGVVFSRDIQGELVAITDRLALEQILDNLILNAIKYGAGKPVDLTLRTDGHFLHIDVSDQGIGMAADDQARIFEPFERAVGYGTRAGFGVGLWVVRQLVDAMGGKIEVESVLGQGTRFKVTLPHQRTAEQQ